MNNDTRTEEVRFMDDGTTKLIRKGDRVLAVRRLQFCAGHRVAEHESHCAHLHGHNYVVYLHALGKMDSLGRVVDFGVLKRAFDSWIQAHWDHGFIVWEKDKQATAALNAFDAAMRAMQHGDFTQRVFALPANPTAENMALYLLHTVGPEVLNGSGAQLVRVVLYETENCYADVRLDNAESL